MLSSTKDDDSVSISFTKLMVHTLNMNVNFSPSLEGGFLEISLKLGAEGWEVYSVGFTSCISMGILA